MNIGVYPGSFDPFTIGHLDVLKRAAVLFDTVYVAVLCNNQKQPFFSGSERIGFIVNAVNDAGLANISVSSFDGLLVDYAQKIGANCIIRGLRTNSDFEYEFQLSAINRKLNPEIASIYLMSDPEHAYISSSLVKEAGKYRASIKGLVPEINEKIIAERLLKR